MDANREVIERLERAAAGENCPATGPFTGLARGAFRLGGRIGEGEDERPLVEGGQGPDHRPCEGIRRTGRANDFGGLQDLDRLEEALGESVNR